MWSLFAKRIIHGTIENVTQFIVPKALHCRPEYRPRNDARMSCPWRSIPNELDSLIHPTPPNRENRNKLIQIDCPIVIPKFRPIKGSQLAPGGRKLHKEISLERSCGSGSDKKFGA